MSSFLSGKQRLQAVALILCLTAQTFAFTACRPVADSQSAGRELAPIAVPGGYYEYRSRHMESISAGGRAGDVIISGADGSAGEQAVTRILRAEDDGAYLLWENEEGEVSWDFTIQDAGFYYIWIRYKGAGSRFTEAVRKVVIDGETPYDELESVSFSKAFANAAAQPAYDNRGNQLRPAQVLADVWQEGLLYAEDGLVAEPLGVYLEKGSHTFTFIGFREPIAIAEIRLRMDIQPQSYEEYLASVQEQATGGVPSEIRVQGEAAKLKSSPSFFPIAARDNCYTEPFSLDETVFNAIGGESWNLSGQWIEWEFTVREAGYYKLGIRCKQDYYDGMAVARDIELDGRMLFTELRGFSIDYKTGWQLARIQRDGEDCLIYLTPGVHTLRLTARLHKTSTVLHNLQAITQDMLALYEQIVMVTGVSPDTLRDYELPKRIPGLLASMETCADRLDELAAHLNAASGGSMSDAHTMESISERMRLMIDDPSRIAGKLYDYRDSIMQLSSSILVLSRSALCVDYISFTPEDSAFPRVNPSFTEQLASDARAFALSFFKDYNSIGNAYNAMDSITVWAMVGRDQADELKVLIDSGFTPETKINVNLNIISSESVLLYSAISGNPPDAALGISGGAPVDYGLRGAAMDLTAFDDYRQVVERFSPAAMTPFEYGESVYALPYTFAFPVMFYRTDVFEELGLEPPQTWEETRTVIQALQENNLTAGLMGTYDAASGLLGLTILNSMFFQNGAAYYNDSKTRCLLDSPEALSAFESYTDWFSLFSLPEEYDAYTRFRLGEMPLFIADFTQYNTLSVSAPEIKGLWKMAPIPGTALGDGRINAAVSSVSTASVIMERTEKADAAWKFLKWWTSAETQTRYSVNIEALLGAGGRYNSATVEALEGLDWRQEDLETIALGIEKAVGVPYIPGSYFTSRHLSNAFWEVITLGRVPRTSLLKYVDQINAEILKKRAEFGLSAE